MRYQTTPVQGNRKTRRNDPELRLQHDSAGLHGEQRHLQEFRVHGRDEDGPNEHVSCRLSNEQYRRSLYPVHSGSVDSDVTNLTTVVAHPICDVTAVVVHPICDVTTVVVHPICDVMSMT